MAKYKTTICWVKDIHTDLSIDKLQHDVAACLKELKVNVTAVGDFIQSTVVIDANNYNHARLLAGDLAEEVSDNVGGIVPVYSGFVSK